MIPGLIETVRVEGRRLAPLWPLHLVRLTASARKLGLELPPRLPGEGEVVGAAAWVEGEIAAVRLTVQGGAFSLVARPVGAAAAGWRACLVPWRRGDDPQLRSHKTTGRAELDAAAGYARERGCDEALWTHEEGRLTEGTVTNVFARVGGRLVTPPLSRGLLPGIARSRLLLAGTVGGVSVVEGDLSPGELAGAEEAFVTNAVRGAVPLTAVDGNPLPRGELWRAASAVVFGRIG